MGVQSVFAVWICAYILSNSLCRSQMDLPSRFISGELVNISLYFSQLVLWISCIGVQCTLMGFVEIYMSILKWSVGPSPPEVI